MGGLSSLMGMMPGLGLGGGKMPEIDTDEAEKNMRRIEAIIRSMTPQERKIRICSIQAERTALQEDAGVQVAEVNRLVKQFEQTKK